MSTGADLSVEPTREQLEALAQSPDDGPVLMLNLLAFRPGGRERYRSYMTVAQRALDEVGATVALFAQAHEPFIGPQDETWDEVLIVRYPNRQAFLRMLSLDYYREALEHRREALARTRIFPLSLGARSVEGSSS